MDTREGSIFMSYSSRPEEEVILVVDSTPNFAYHFASEKLAREAYPGVIFELEQVDFLGVKFLTMFPPGVDSMSPATRKKILCGAIRWAMGQLPPTEPGLTRATHAQIHQVEKLWNQK